MFDNEDREQNEMDEQYVSDLEAALKRAIEEADGWCDDAHGQPCFNLDKERALICMPLVDGDKQCLDT